MKRLKHLLVAFCCFMVPFAFSAVCHAMDFDAEVAYESIFVIYSGFSEGSGFALGSNAVITNAHVIGNKNDILVESYSGEEYRASVYLFDEQLDIAVLAVENAEFQPLEVGDCENVKIGEDIYAIGAPRSLGYTLTKGVISNKARMIGENNYLQIDAAINAGNSGGPLLNKAGQVIGVNSMKISDAEGIGLAIPITGIIGKLEENGIALTEKEQVDGTIEYAPPVIPDPESEEDAEVQTTQDYTVAVVLGVFLGASLITNVILIILLAQKKKRNLNQAVVDPRERTDFDIDILE